MQKTIEEIMERCRHYTNEGNVASYIPELAKARAEDLGIFVMTSRGEEFCYGDCDKRFTIQSISKTLILLMALMDNGIEKIKSQVGVEATGKPFNAIDYSEHLILKEHINPMVNIGAIAMCSMVAGKSYEEKWARLMDFARHVTGNSRLAVDENVFSSEKVTGDKNRALAYLLKSSGIITDDVGEILDLYFRMCSLSVSCRDLASLALLLADHGRDRTTGKQVLPREYARFTNAILSTCGMYDGSGEFAIRVGVPAKSGVGGGILAVVPERMGIGIYSPALDNKGNSVAGVRVLEALSKTMELSIF
jgi:glutaminase